MIDIIFKTKYLHLDNDRKFRNIAMENYLKENNVDHIIGVLIIHNIKELLKHLIKLSRFLISTKDHHKRKFCLVDSINDLLIYYNDRRHNTTQMRPFKLITRSMIKIAQKAKENTIKSIKKIKINTEVFNVGQKVRESICIRILVDSIFVKIQLLNKYSKGVKRKCGYQKTDCIFKVELLQSKYYRKLRNRMGEYN